jgi:hypothetical protein
VRHLDYLANVEARHEALLRASWMLDPAGIGDPRDDGFVYPYEAAERMGITEAEVRRLARQGALEVRGRYVRPALVSFVLVR